MTDAITTIDAEQQGPVLILTLNGPKTRNTLGVEVYTGITTHLAAAQQDATIRAVVITGADGYFCAGGNIHTLQTSAKGTLAEATAGTDRLNALIRAVHDCPLPVVAAVEGGAAGAGLSLLLACDIILAATEAKFSLAYVKIGLTPDGGATHLLRAALPRQMVMEMALTGQPVTAQRLADLGVISALMPKGGALPAALTLANSLATGPRQAQARIKHVVNMAAQNDLATHQDLEATNMNTSRFGSEAAEGLAAFLAKRKPDFT